MSVDNLKQFGKLCAENETIKERVQEIGLNNAEALIAYAGEELNLEFSLDDMAALANENDTPVDELSEEDLEKVAGGKWIIPQDDE